MTSKSQRRRQATQMLKFLKKEEAFYVRTLQNMKQESQRLDIEEFTIKAAIRKEQLKLDHQNVDENTSSSSSSLQADDHPQKNVSQDDDSQKSMNQNDDSQNSLNQDDDSQTSLSQDDDSQKSQDDLSQNSISQPSPTVNDSESDERDLEPLILNPHHHDDAVVEFDD